MYISYRLPQFIEVAEYNNRIYKLVMIEDQRKRIEKAVSDMIQDMYKTHLRKMQSDMHVCAVKCCNDLKTLPSLDNVQSCIEDCAVPLMRAQDYVQHELGQFESKLQNCVMQCTDDVRSSTPLNIHETDISKYRYQFETCTAKCVEKHLGLIPSMMRSIKTVLANGSKNMKHA